jgi:predicted ATPase
MLPSGTVTFLFTDIVGSTARWEADPAVMRIALAEHNTILEAVVSEFGGHLFKTVGDAFCVAFSQPEEALAAASRVHAQLALASNPLQVRIGIHTGQISPTGNDYFGPPVNKVARIQSVANGGQTLFSDATRGLMPAKLECKDLGSHSLKDLLEPTRLWQLGHEDFAELKSLSSIPNNLPIQSTSFVGRNEEMSQIGGLLEKSRLVTLTGTGGTGKSRLSIQVAAENLNQFPDGIWFCEFAPIADREDVLPILATCLDLPASPDGLRERLLGHLKSKKSLLILDNCEHVLDSVSQLAEQILGQCPTVTLLVTSREPLGSRGETTFRVPSLALPASNERVPIEMLEEFGSTALFLERLATVAPSYRLETQDSPRIAQICRRLDGIPLAIELAAARPRAMTLDQIEKKLDDRFRLLTGGSRNALSRLQTLRALIDWSFRLLNEWERAFFVSLAVFTGGWDLAAAETICSQGLEDVDEFEVIDLLTALVDKSLVVFDQRTGHYHLLESLRQYGLEQLELVPWALTLRDRHGEVFLPAGEGVCDGRTGRESRPHQPLLDVPRRLSRCGGVAFRSR